jgi:hypothetical protein
VVTDGAGGAVVAFNDWVPRQSSWGRGVPVSATRDHEELDALMAVGDGGAIVNVVSAHLGSEPLAHTWVQSYRVAADGHPLWGKGGVRLSAPAADGLDYSSFGQVDDGRLRAVWVHEPAAFADTYDIHFAEITLAGERLVPAAGLPLTQQPRQKFVYGFAYDATSRRSLAAYLDIPDIYSLDFGVWDAAAALYPPP